MDIIISNARSAVSNVNKIHIDKVPIKLESCTPTPLDPEQLTTQLNDMGLYCSETRGERLAQNIEEVTTQIGVGPLETFGIYKDEKALTMEKVKSLRSANNSVMALNKNNSTLLAVMLEENYTKQADGSWTEGAIGQFSAKLQVLQQIDNYNYLKQNALDFPYAESPAQTVKQDVTTVQAIKDLFTKTATACTAATVDGINKTTLDATFSNALVSINESVFDTDYDTKNNRVITLLLNYDPSTQECDGVGVVTCEWHISVQNYKEKKKNPRHETVITVSARSMLYQDVNLLNKHYNMVMAMHKGVNCLLDKSIHIISEVEVYDKLPPANEDTFINSLPCLSETDHAEVIVFYNSDIQKKGFLDNTNSSADTKYSKSISSGFQISTSLSFSYETNFEINAEVVKAGCKFGYNVSLTTQWSTEQTNSIEFSVPAGKKAFLYQVTVLCAKLRLDSKTGKYSYVEYGKFLTDAYKTSDKPLYEDNM
jgi:hypothetical protein